MTTAEVGIHGMVLLAAAGTYLWRGLGAVLAQRVDEDGAAFLLVKTVATALIAGLVARLVLYPPGALADTPLALRLAAVAAGVAAYAVGRRSIPAGLAAAEAVMIGGAWWLG